MKYEKCPLEKVGRFFIDRRRPLENRTAPLSSMKSILSTFWPHLWRDGAAQLKLASLRLPGGKETWFAEARQRPENLMTCFPEGREGDREGVEGGLPSRRHYNTHRPRRRNHHPLNQPAKGRPNLLNPLNPGYRVAP